FNDDASRRRITRLIRELRPEIVVTSSPQDYLCDHEATSQLVRDACFGASLPNYRTGGTGDPLLTIPHLYFMDPIEMVDRAGEPVPPDFVIDVQSTFEIKKTMLAKHESQRSWLKRQHGIDDYVNQMEAWTRARGAYV